MSPSRPLTRADQLLLEETVESQDSQLILEALKAEFRPAAVRAAQPRDRLTRVMTCIPRFCFFLRALTGSWANDSSLTRPLPRSHRPGLRARARSLGEALEMRWEMCTLMMAVRGEEGRNGMVSRFVLVPCNAYLMALTMEKPCLWCAVFNAGHIHN